jgi:hypothetical protein
MSISAIPPSSRSPGEHKKMPLMLKIFFAIAILGSVAGYYSYFKGRVDYLAVIDSQIDDLRKNRLTKAYYEYFSPDYQKEISLEEFKEQMAILPSLQEAKKWDLKRVNEEEDRVELQVALLNQEKSLYLVEYLLIKEDGEWKIRRWAATPYFENHNEKIADSPISFIQEWLSTVNQTKNDRLYFDSTTNAFKKATSLEKFKHFLKTYPMLGNNHRVEFLKESTGKGQATVEAMLTHGIDTLPVSFELDDEHGHWRIDSILLVEENEADLTDQESATELNAVVEKHLNLIEEGKIEEAYSDTAKGFKATTTLDEFNLFLQAYPVLRDHDGSTYSPYFDHGMGKVKLILEKEERKYSAEFTLIQENGEWKIWGLVIHPHYPIANQTDSQEPFDWDPVLNVIQGQLEAIKNKKYEVAYNQFTSDSFQKVTTFEVFKNFLVRNSVFSDNIKAEFTAFSFEENVALVQGSYKSAKGENRVVDYQLVEEDGAWKILAIRVQKEGTTPQEKKQTNAKQYENHTMNFAKINLNQNPLTSQDTHMASYRFKKGISRIYGLITVKEAEQGAPVTISLRHEESGEKSPSVKYVLTNEGDAFVRFSLSSPKEEWPTGHYELIVNSTKANQKKFAFEIY